MPERAEFDYAALGRLLRPKLERDGRGYRALADEIGVAASVFSRLGAGQPVAAHSVIAVCDWLGCDLRTFYARRECFTGHTVKQQRNQGLGAIVDGLRERT